VTISYWLSWFVLAYALAFIVTLALNLRAGWRLTQRRRFTRRWVDDLRSSLAEAGIDAAAAFRHDDRHDEPRRMLASR
jgi:hypothetical protein